MIRRLRCKKISSSMVKPFLGNVLFGDFVNKNNKITMIDMSSVHFLVYFPFLGLLIIPLDKGEFLAVLSILGGDPGPWKRTLYI